MDPEGAIRAIATNMAKKKKGESVEEKWTRKYKRVPLIATIQKDLVLRVLFAGRNKK